MPLTIGDYSLGMVKDKTEMKALAHKSRRKQAVLVVGTILLIPLGYFGLQILGDRVDEKLISAKAFRQTSATVTKKEYIRFDEMNHSYITDLGQRVDVQPGDQQWRVYYEFDNFDQFEEPFRSRLVQLEKKRISEGKLRFSFKNFNDRRWYDSVEVGDKLVVSYKPYSDGEIEIASVIKAEP